MGTPASLRVTEHFLVAYRHVWRGSVVVSFIGPTLFLAAIGVGLGSIVDAAPGGASSYLDWVAPGLLASAAMQTAAAEATYPVMMGTKWLRTYHSMLASPVSAADVVTGHLTFIVLRLLTTAVVFAGMTAAFGVPGGARLVGAVVAAVLCGLAFAAPIAAWSVTRTMDASFVPLFRFVIAPLFLFSGAFFPVSQLPDALAAAAVLTPTWHGVSLCRNLLLGVGAPLVDLGHALFLGVWIVGGGLAARRTYARRLTP